MCEILIKKYKFIVLLEGQFLVEKDELARYYQRGKLGKGYMETLCIISYCM